MVIRKHRKGIIGCSLDCGARLMRADEAITTALAWRGFRPRVSAEVLVLQWS
jgi:hypothetical protein